MMKRRILLLLCCLLLCACTAGPVEGAAKPVSELAPDELPARQSMVFLLAGDADELLWDAAKLFAHKISAFTEGYLDVEVRNSVSAVADFESGIGDFLFLDSRVNSDFCSDFSILSEPMRYPDYDTFTMGLNSKRMLDSVCSSAEQKNVLLLAAFYQSGSFFISEGSVSGLRRNSGDSEEQNESKSLAVLQGNSEIGALLWECGFETQVEMDLTARYTAIMEGEAALAEFALEEINAVNFNDSGLYLVNVLHSVAPCWLAVDRERFEAFPASYQAAIQEATAYLFPVIDGGYRGREREMTARLREQGITVERSFPALRDTADRAAMSEMTTDIHKRYLLNMLYGLE